MSSGKPPWRQRPLFWSLLALLLLGVNIALLLGGAYRRSSPLFPMLWMLLAAQGLIALVALVLGLMHVCGRSRSTGVRVAGFLSMLVALPPAWFSAMSALFG